MFIYPFIYRLKQLHVVKIRNSEFPYFPPCFSYRNQHGSTFDMFGTLVVKLLIKIGE